MMIASLFGGTFFAFVSAIAALVMGSGILFAVMLYVLGGIAGMAVILGFALAQRRMQQAPTLAMTI